MGLHASVAAGSIHIPYNWSYASLAAREAAAGLVSGDLGKIALQTDNNTLWVLTATTPTWVQIGELALDLTPVLGADLNANDKAISSIKKLNLAEATELTIASGVITITQSNHKVDTESDSASDDLATINGGADGDMLIIAAEHTDRTVVLKHGTGNILIGGDADYSLDDTTKRALLIRGATNWYKI